MFAPAYCVRLMGRFSNTLTPLLLFVPVSFVFFSIAVVTVTFDKMFSIQHVLLLNSHPSHELKLIYVPLAHVYLLSSISSFLAVLHVFKKPKPRRDSAGIGQTACTKALHTNGRIKTY